MPWIMPPDEFKPTRFMWRMLKDEDVEPRNIIARSQFPDVIANMCLEGRGVAVLFDHFAASGLADGRIVKIGPQLPSTSRILLIGPRAQESAPAKAVLSFERALLDGDLAAVSALTTPERFAGLDADFARAGPVVFLEQVRAQLPEPAVRQRQIREVVIHGRRAWVVMVNDDGSRTIAAVVHIDGAWKVD